MLCLGQDGKGKINDPFYYEDDVIEKQLDLMIKKNGLV
jgi:hypothetical protein